MRSSGPLRWVGAWPVKVAFIVLIAATLLGVVFTLVAGKEPGFLIGLFITIGGAIAALGVRRGGVYLFFPLPALSAFVAAVLTGEIHDRQLASSTAGTAAGFTQWLAGVFYPMCVATIVVLLVGAFRWLLARQLVSGQFAMSAGRPSPGSRPAPGGRRPATDDPWSDQDPSANGATRVLGDRSQQDRPAPGPAGPGRTPWLGPDGARSARPARDQRPDRDAWGDPRPGTDRNQPGAPSRPRPDGRAARPPGPGQPRPQQPRDPRDPRPQRPQPRQPRDPWD